jgi:phage N-6-adenine-methyltransferase
MNKALLSSSEKEWCTPRDFFAELDKEFHFTLDAAATKENALCANFYTAETDGLAHPWYAPKYGAVFCNPPYGRAIGQWVKKASDEARCQSIPIVMLLPARTDTSYFHDYIYHRAGVEIRFLRGRLKFTDSAGTTFWPAPFPSMIVIFNWLETAIC